MRITKYDLFFNEKKRPMLIKEECANYKEYHLIDPKTCVSILNTLEKLNQRTEEYAYLVGVDTKCKIKGIFELSHGSAEGAILDCKNIFIRLLLSCSTAFFIVHNHPSGEVKPSKEDFAVKNKIKAASEVMDYKFLDFIIIGENTYLSFMEDGLL